MPPLWLSLIAILSLLTDSFCAQRGQSRYPLISLWNFLPVHVHVKHTSMWLLDNLMSSWLTFSDFVLSRVKLGRWIPWKWLSHNFGSPPPPFRSPSPQGSVAVFSLDKQPVMTLIQPSRTPAMLPKTATVFSSTYPTEPWNTMVPLLGAVSLLSMTIVLLMEAVNTKIGE